MSKLPEAVPGAYVITHQPTGRFYVGSSRNVRVRMIHHLHLLNNSKHYARKLQEVFTTRDDIAIEVIPTETKDDALDSEQVLLDRLYSDPLCCNNAPGARSLWKGDFPEDRRQRQSELMKGHHVPDHVREAVRKANTGLKRSPETRQRMREAHAKQTEERCIPVMVDGVEYKSNKEAIEKLGINGRTLTKRLKSDDPKWAGWRITKPTP